MVLVFVFVYAFCIDDQSSLLTTRGNSYIFFYLFSRKSYQKTNSFFDIFQFNGSIHSYSSEPYLYSPQS